jgi:hypothetical protein
MRRSRGDAGARLAFATDRQLQQLAPRSTSLTSINRQVSDVLEEPKAPGFAESIVRHRRSFGTPRLPLGEGREQV